MAAPSGTSPRGQRWFLRRQSGSPDPCRPMAPVRCTPTRRPECPAGQSCYSSRLRPLPWADFLSLRRSSPRHTAGKVRKVRRYPRARNRRQTARARLRCLSHRRGSMRTRLRRALLVLRFESLSQPRRRRSAGDRLFAGAADPRLRAVALFNRTWPVRWSADG